MEEQYNPYRTPESEVRDIDVNDDVEPELATRWSRLFAAILDTMLQLLIIMPIMYYLGVFDAAAQGEELPLLTTIGLTILGIVIYLLLHGHLLKKNGQTIGKKMMKIRILRSDNRLSTLFHLITLRTLPVTLLSVIPYGIGTILSIAEVLTIFRADRRCVHDMIADTKVVKVK
uniref:RDD family protein n=1 Tax=uncultured Thiotrichaceae bacterium TaxID=298394 RepID=A0A6S6TP02_9GAMM|nr:MAG: RDD family protein [uncultured Thiotrichaceae bacterium]